MSDTVRNKTDLLALCPDNFSGLITPQVLRDILVSVVNLLSVDSGARIEIGVGSGAALNIVGNNGPTTNAGNININGGDSIDHIGGDVVLSGGNSDNAANGNVIVNSPLHASTIVCSDVCDLLAGFYVDNTATNGMTSDGALTCHSITSDGGLLVSDGSGSLNTYGIITSSITTGTDGFNITDDGSARFNVKVTTQAINANNSIFSMHSSQGDEFLRYNNDVGLTIGLTGGAAVTTAGPFTVSGDITVGEGFRILTNSNSFQISDDGGDARFNGAVEIGNKLLIGFSVNSGISGSSSKCFPVYNQSGTLLGYCPLYATHA